MPEHTTTRIDVAAFTYTARNDHGGIDCHDCVELTSRMDDGNVRFVAQLFPFLDTCPKLAGEVWANAALFAAAPDLLDVLQAAMARIELANAEGDPILSAWIPEARAAVARALGERSYNGDD